MSLVSDLSPASKANRRRQTAPTDTSPQSPVVIRNDESWVDISSQPSSSSLSSIAEDLGLVPARRRRLHPARSRSTATALLGLHPHAVASSPLATTSTSSQEEYEETESEDDRILTSSTENLASPAAAPEPFFHPSAPPTAFKGSYDDVDTAATNIGICIPTLAHDSSSTFRPQPNAFSHPPALANPNIHFSDMLAPSSPPHRHTSRRTASSPALPPSSYPSTHRRPFPSPSVRTDNDALLRASLTTLLSCAAAARALPKTTTVAAPSSAAPAIGTMDLRLIPESELPDTEVPAPAPVSVRKRASTSSSSSRSPPRSIAKKMRTVPDDALLGSTLLSWVFGAGVVVVLVSLGAGYVIGREVGRQEAGLAAAAAAPDLGLKTVHHGAISCSREFMPSAGGSLRRFCWGASVMGVA